MLDFIQDYAGWGWNGFTDFIVPFLIVLSVLVFVHEFGHYIVARWCGVRVDKFSIGFGPEIYGFNDRAGTRWRISLIPLGGYVQMFGDTDPASAQKSDKVKEGEETRPMTNEEKKVAFFGKPVWQRAAIVFAGPAINFIFAILILVGLYVSVGKPVSPPVASAIMVEGAADNAGMQPHDRILAIDGKKIESFEDIQRQVAISLDRPIDVRVLRNGGEVTITVTPERQSLEDRFGFEHTRGMIGIMSADKGVSIESIQTIDGRDVSTWSVEQKWETLSGLMGQSFLIGLPTAGENGVQNLEVNVLPALNEIGNEELILSDVMGQEIVTYGAVDAFGAAVKETWFIITGTLEAIGQIITGTRSATELGGIVRIGAIAGDAAQSGLMSLIAFTALLSINLGLINLFPIPLLDGGHLVFYAYEAVFGKQMPEKVMDYALRFGMVFLICLMAFANLNDIFQMVH